jgi:hypothetical protein
MRLPLRRLLSVFLSFVPQNLTLLSAPFIPDLSSHPTACFVALVICCTLLAASLGAGAEKYSKHCFFSSSSADIGWLAVSSSASTAGDWVFQNPVDAPWWSISALSY